MKLSDQLFRWLLPDFHTAVSPNMSALRGRLTAHVYFPHTFSSQPTLLNPGWPHVTDLYGPCLRNWQSASFLLYPSSSNYWKKINSRLKPSNWMHFLFWKAQFSAEKYPTAKAAPALFPSFAPRSSILMNLSSHWIYFLPKCSKPTRRSWLIMPKSFIANKQDWGAILEITVTSKTWDGLS